MDQTELPVQITAEQLTDPRIARVLAERAYLLARYDFYPDGDIVQTARERNLLVEV